MAAAAAVSARFLADFASASAFAAVAAALCFFAAVANFGALSN
jgi:hypothetical protein